VGYGFKFNQHSFLPVEPSDMLQEQDDTEEHSEVKQLIVFLRKFYNYCFSSQIQQILQMKLNLTVMQRKRKMKKKMLERRYM
jgi:hypothetical protein